MSVRYFLLACALAFPLSMSAAVAEDGLSAPVVSLMPHVKALRPALNLSEQQAATIDSWVASAPTKRARLEARLKQLRSQMREAILADESRWTREGLKAEIAETELRLIEMRALCTRMLRSTLDQDQFARVVARYRQQLAG